MIHWHKWVEEQRHNMEGRKMTVPSSIATHSDYEPDLWPGFPLTMFLFRCSKCQAVKVTEVKGHWAK